MSYISVNPLNPCHLCSKISTMQHPFTNNEQTPVPLLRGGKLTINEYLLIVQPHEDLYNKIMLIKQSFAEKYDCPLAAYTKPHITIINFVQWEMQELKLINRLKNVVATNNPFLVTINGFGSFPTHTIYANIQTKNNLVGLVKSMKPVQSILTLDSKNKPHFITEPHLTIARKLLPWQYEKAWLEYSNTPFTASFMVNELVLLKRQVDTKKYTVATSFPLLNQLKESTQATLFI